MNSLFKKGFASLALASAMVSGAFGNGDKMDAWMSITKKEQYMIIGSTGNDDNGSVAVIGFNLKSQTVEPMVFVSADDKGSGNLDGNTAAQMFSESNIFSPHNLSGLNLAAFNAEFGNENVAANKGEDAKGDTNSDGNPTAQMLFKIFDSHNDQLLTDSSTNFGNGNNVNTTIATNNINYETTEVAFYDGNSDTKNGKDANSYNAGADDENKVNATNDVNYGTTEKAPDTDDSGNGNVATNNTEDANSYNDTGNGNNINTTIAANNVNYGNTKEAPDTNPGNGNVAGNNDADADYRNKVSTTAATNNYETTEVAFYDGNADTKNGKDVKGDEATNGEDAKDDGNKVSTAATNNYGTTKVATNNGKNAKYNSGDENNVNTTTAANYVTTNSNTNFGNGNVAGKNSEDTNGEDGNTGKNIEYNTGKNTVASIVATNTSDTNNGVKSGDNVPASSEQAA